MTGVLITVLAIFTMAAIAFFPEQAGAFVPIAGVAAVVVVVTGATRRFTEL